MHLATLPVILVLTGATVACSQQGSTSLTFYGWPDNDPPSADVAYDCGGRNYIAGGTGTYSNPLTMASAEGEFAPCEIIYLPILEKYVRYEDYCQQCTDDWGSGIRHIDIWTGSSTGSGGNAQVDCEDTLTPDGKVTVIRNPASNYKVDSAALWDGSCETSHVYPSNKASQFCS